MTESSVAGAVAEKRDRVVDEAVPTKAIRFLATYGANVNVTPRLTPSRRCVH